MIEPGTPTPESEPRWWARGVNVLIGLGFACVFLYLAVRKVDLHQAASILLSVDLSRGVPLAAISFITMLLRVWRWALMFPSNFRPKIAYVFDAFILGAATNSVMPGRLGDFARAASIGRHIPALGFSGAFATVILEKILDLVAILLLMAITLWFAIFPGWLTQAAPLGAYVCLAALGLFYWLSLLEQRNGLHKISGKLAEGEPSRARVILQRVLQQCAMGLSMVTSMRQLTAFLMIGLLIWWCEVLLVYSSFAVFDLKIPLGAAVVTIVLLSVGTMLPAAPGFVGTYQFFVVTALGQYQISQDVALAFAVFLNIFVIGFSIAMAMLTMVLRFAKKHRS